MDDEHGFQNRARVNLPIHQMLLQSIDNLEIFTYDGFLLIEADPRKFESQHALVDFKNKEMSQN